MRPQGVQDPRRSPAEDAAVPVEPAAGDVLRRRYDVRLLAKGLDRVRRRIIVPDRSPFDVAVTRCGKGRADAEQHQLLRLPLYHELSLSEQDYILRCIADFFQESNSIKTFNNKLIGKIAGHLAGLSMLDEVLLNGIFA